MSALVIVLLLGAWATTRGGESEDPLSSPPPHGGLATAPPTLAGIPALAESKMGPIREGASTIFEDIPTGQPTVFQYYLGTAAQPVQGLLSLIATAGPADQLPDRAGARGKLTTFGVVRCGQFYSDIRESGHYEELGEAVVCWRTSGTFSLSILATQVPQEELAQIVNEAWAAQ